MTEIPGNTEGKPDSSPSSSPQRTGEDRIRLRAYQLFEKRNGAAGDAESDWLRAEAEINSESAIPAK